MHSTSLLKELKEPEEAATKSAKPGAAETKKATRARQIQGCTLSEAGRRKGRQITRSQEQRDTHRQIARRRQGGTQGSSDSTISWENWARPRTSRPPRTSPGIGLGRKGRQQPSRGDKADADKLGGKDKDLDERLEELTGPKEETAEPPIKSAPARSAR